MKNISYGSAESNYNKQLAGAYIIYMMFGSYFRSCRMRNTLEEGHLKAHYTSMKQGAQYDKEQELDELSAQVLSEVPAGIRVDRLNCEVRCARVKGMYYVYFVTGLVDHMATVNQKGQVTILRVSRDAVRVA